MLDSSLLQGHLIRLLRDIAEKLDGVEILMCYSMKVYGWHSSIICRIDMGTIVEGHIP